MNKYLFGEILCLLIPMWHALFLVPIPWLNSITAFMLILDVAMVCGYAKMQYFAKRKPEVWEFIKHFHIIRSYIAANVFSALLPHCSVDSLSINNCALLVMAVGCVYLWLSSPWLCVQSIHEAIKGRQ